jgi:hypothetical protein
MRWQLALLAVAGCGDNLAERVLFVRGADGTGEVSDIADADTSNGNHGYAQLAELLRHERFSVEQVIEPLALDDIDLDRYAVVFFASNNAAYTERDAAHVRDYVEAGGGVLFVSDALWGPAWGTAAASDQTFLSQFGLVMNHDAGQPSESTKAFVVPGHPILADVDAFEGEGVSPCTLTHDPETRGIVTRVVAQTTPVRRPLGVMGPLTAPTDDDAALATVEDGGRVACSFDRNTFFNEHGAGTSIARASNARYALNLFAWLARRI